VFHIPFELRHKVQSQRYSVPGLPCLYLGGSLYTCWAEMGRPGFHELFASAFWLREDQKVRLVDLSQRPNRLVRRLTSSGELQDDGDHDSLLCHLTLWPLAALCSIIVKHRDSFFKSEYIIPQILLQWITAERAFDGICYSSTHVSALAPLDRPKVVCNFVFPAQQKRPDGRCSFLRQLFKMTEPQSWQLLAALGVPFARFQVRAPYFDFEFVNRITQQYAETEFGRVEYRLDCLVAAIKHENTVRDKSLGDVLP
jgi:hypothetical protein